MCNFYSLVLDELFCLFFSNAVTSKFLGLGFADNRLNRVRDDFREDFTDVDSKPPNLQHLSHSNHPPPPSHPHSSHPPLTPYPSNHVSRGTSHTSPHTLALNASLSPRPAPYGLSSTSTINSKYS